jgi:hypothetical protein
MSTTPILPRPIPNLDGTTLPQSLKTAIRRIYSLLYDLRDTVVQGFAALPRVRSFSVTLTPAAPTVYVSVPVGGTITAWTIMLDAGTATVKLWRVPAGGTALPVAADTMSTAGLDITVGTVLRSEDLRDFKSTAIGTNDIIAVHLQASAGAAWVVFQLEITT